MRIYDGVVRIVVIGCGLGLAVAHSFDGTPSGNAPALDRKTPLEISNDRMLPPGVARAPVIGVRPTGRIDDAPRPPAAIPNAGPASLPTALTPLEAFRSGTQALKAGETDKAITSLQYAAEQGHAVAQWKLGRMYAEGEGVPRSEARAFEYFSRIANAHADDSPHSAHARFVANAFVALGHYYRDGIPNSTVKRDPDRAREMYSYAASYFGDADAQYFLARLYLTGSGAERDPRRAVRWLGLAAQKGHFQAQALLGRMLFQGDEVPRQAARGLMWLTLARDSAGAREAWVAELYESAFKQATNDERASAVAYLERWIKGRRE